MTSPLPTGMTSKHIHIGGQTLRLIGQVGSGGTGSVKFGLEEGDPCDEDDSLSLKKRKIYDENPLAIKIIKTDPHRPLPLAPKDEASLVRSLPPHLHLVKLLKSGELDRSHFAIVMPYHPLDLFSLVEKSRGLSEPLARVLLGQLVNVLSHCRASRVAHRDLKPENVLLQPSEKGLTVKLTDFGYAVRLANSATEVKGYLGTPGYVAPEVEKRKAYDPFAADIFSLGCLLFVMVAGQKPFPGKPRDCRWYRTCLSTGKTDLFFKAHRRTCTISPSLERLLIKMLAWNPKDRASLEEITVSPWMKEKDGLPTAEQIFAEVGPTLKTIEAERPRFLKPFLSSLFSSVEVDPDPDPTPSEADPRPTAEPTDSVETIAE